MAEIGNDKKPEDGFHPLQMIESDFIKLLKEIDMLRSGARRSDEEARKSTKSLLLSLLEVMDGFDRVFKNVESKESTMDKQTKIWIGNFKSIRKQFEMVLREEGVEPLEAINQKALPGLHKVLDTKEIQGIGDDTIIEETKKGYCWNGEVLRKSEVIVAKH